MEQGYIELGEIKIYEKDIPIEYTWSRNINSIDEFEQKNFFVVNRPGKRSIVCSGENLVALTDYLASYLFRSELFADMEAIFSPDMDLWFLLAYEMLCTSIEDFPDWVKDYIDILIHAGIIQEISGTESCYYIVPDIEDRISNPLSKDVEDEIEKAFTKRVIEYWIEIQESGDEVNEPDCGEWGKRLYRRLILENAEVEITAECHSENGPSLGFGICQRVMKYWNDDTWIYEGISDVINENWYEFDPIAEEAVGECSDYYSREGKPSSRKEITNRVKTILRRKMGEYSIEYSVDCPGIKIEYENKVADISDDIYECVCENLCIVSSVLGNLGLRSNEHGIIE